MRAHLLALSLLVAAGCATVPQEPHHPIAAPTEADRRLVAELRSEAAAFLAEQAEIFWQAWTEGAPIEVEALYARHAALFAPERYAALERVRHAETDPRARRALTLLQRWLAGEDLARAVAPLSRRLAELEAFGTFSFEGEEHDWRNLPTLLAAEPDPDRRLAIQRAAIPVLRQVGEVVTEQRRRLDEAARLLGHESGLAATAALRGRDPAGVEALARAILETTDPLYEEVFGTVARRELGVELSDLRRADLPRLFAGAGFATFFPAEDPQGPVRSTLGSLGFDAERLPIRIVEAEPIPRPLAFPVAPPQDVRLALPSGGRDWAATFHEMGAALRAVHLAEAPFELAQLGDEATAEAFAVLFENLTADPVWLRAHTRLTGAEASAHAAAAATRRLHAVRLAAGRLAFQVERQNSRCAPDDSGCAASEAEAIYRRVMGRTLGFALGEADGPWGWVDRDEWLYGVETLEAWILAAVLEEHLVERHGEAWWRSEEAGRELVALWAASVGKSPAEVAEGLGEGRALDPAALERQLRLRLAAFLPKRI